MFLVLSLFCTVYNKLLQYVCYMYLKYILIFISRTLKAMRGGLTFREALQKRLELIQPSTTMINNYLMSHPAYLTPGIE